MNGSNAALARLTEALAARKLVVAVDDSQDGAQDRLDHARASGLQGDDGERGSGSSCDGGRSQTRPDTARHNDAGMDGYQVCKAIKQTP